MTTENALSDDRRIASLSLVLSLLLSTGTLLGIKTYKRYLKPMKNAVDIPTNVFKRRWLYGKVTSVGDGDNFRFLHLPGGLRAGWGWLRSVPKLDFETNLSKTNLSKTNPILDPRFKNLRVKYRGKTKLPTISIRLCGIDAPERAHFGKKAQPYSEDALIWLRHYILGRKIWIKPLTIDQYGRCVARAVVWKKFRFEDVSSQLLKQGLAVVFEGKYNTEFDGFEKRYHRLECIARLRKKGLWKQKSITTPGEFKKR